MGSSTQRMKNNNNYSVAKATNSTIRRQNLQAWTDVTKEFISPHAVTKRNDVQLRAQRKTRPWNGMC